MMYLIVVIAHVECGVVDRISITVCNISYFIICLTFLDYSDLCMNCKQILLSFEDKTEIRPRLQRLKKKIGAKMKIED